MSTTIPHIAQLIPQAPPFVLIDELLEAGEQGARSRFQIRQDSPCVKAGVLQESGLIEHIAQTAAAQAGYLALQAGLPVKKGFIAAIKNLEILRLPAVGETLETAIRVAGQVLDFTLIQGELSSQGEVLCRCEMRIFIREEE